MINKIPYLAGIIFITTMSGLLFGYDTGVIADTLLFIKNEYTLTIEQQECLVAILPFGALLGSLCSGSISKKMGRRILLLIMAIIFIIGTLLCSIGSAIEFIFIGRLIVGVAIGIGCFAAPLYISEISPAKYRGGLVIINTLMVTGGILMAYIVGYYFSKNAAWHGMFAVGLIPAIILAFGLTLLPDSPRWLIQQNKISQARKILERLRGTADVSQELEEICLIVRLERPSNKITSRSLPASLWMGIILAIIQQASGINAILYYAPALFKVFFLDATTDVTFLCTIILGFTNFFHDFYQHFYH